MTKVTMITKASPIGDRVIPDSLIHFCNEPPAMSLKESRVWFDSEAQRLYDALPLPGGTIDALLRLLLRKRACLFIVPWLVGEKE